MSTVSRILTTLVIMVIAGLSGSWVWAHYMHSPWTRDGRVRADVVTIAPDISGWVTHLTVHDNQVVKKGDVIFEIDSARYRAAVDERQAKVDHALQAWRLAKSRYERRIKLGSINALSAEEVDNHKMQAVLAETEYKVARAELETAKIDLSRTQVIAPANGTITNLNLQQGNYVTQGHAVLSLIKANSLYVTGYFEETKLPLIRPGQKATLTLMNDSPPLEGTVTSIAKGVANTNTYGDSLLLPKVEQAFNWVRLAQRIPVDISLDNIPAGIILSAGMSVSINLAEPDNP